MLSQTQTLSEWAWLFIGDTFDDLPYLYDMESAEYSPTAYPIQFDLFDEDDVPF